MDCNDETCTECNNSAFRLQLEQQIRDKIANEVEYKMLPICVCERCNNMFEGRLVQKAIDIIKGDKA